LKFETEEEKALWNRALHSARKGSMLLTRNEVEPAEEIDTSAILRNTAVSVPSNNTTIITKRNILPERENVRMIDQELLEDNLGADIQTMKAKYVLLRITAD